MQNNSWASTRSSIAIKQQVLASPKPHTTHAQCLSEVALEELEEGEEDQEEEALEVEEVS